MRIAIMGEGSEYDVSQGMQPRLSFVKESKL